MKVGKYVISFANSKRIKLFFERNTLVNDFVQVIAVNGRELPSVIINNLFEVAFVNHALKQKGDAWLKGTAGCFISHLKALEQAQQDGVDYAIIAEDDAVFRYAPDEICELAQQENYDVVFIYDGMSPGGQRRSFGKAHSIKHLTASELKGTGAVAYIVSHKAMTSILVFSNKALKQGAPCGYDGLLQSTVIKQSEYQAYLNKNKANTLLNNMVNKFSTKTTDEVVELMPGKKGLWQWLPFREVDLKVGVSVPTLVSHNDDGVSLIRH